MKFKHKLLQIELNCEWIIDNQSEQYTLVIEGESIMRCWSDDDQWWYRISSMQKLPHSRGLEFNQVRNKLENIYFQYIEQIDDYLRTIGLKIVNANS